MTVMSLMLMCGVLGQATSDDLATLVPTLSQRWREHKSMRAQYSHTTFREGVQTVQQGTIEQLKETSRLLQRRDTVTDRLENVNGKETKQRIGDESTSIWDGEYLYVYSKGHDKAGRWKTRLDDDPIGRDITRCGGGYACKVVRTDVVQSHVIYVIACDPENQSVARDGGYQLFYRDDGVRVKHVQLNKQGEPWSIEILENIELDVPIDPQRFVFRLPPGVELQELEEGQGLGSRCVDDSCRSSGRSKRE